MKKEFDSSENVIHQQVIKKKIHYLKKLKIFKIKLTEPLLMKNLSMQNSPKQNHQMTHLYTILDSGLLWNKLLQVFYHNNVIYSQITKQSKTSRVFEYSSINIYLLALLNPVQNIEFVFVVRDFILAILTHDMLL